MVESAEPALGSSSSSSSRKRQQEAGPKNAAASVPKKSKIGRFRFHQ